ncbi:MAG: ABC transporter ATP-binding protein [Alphaproteobacteria bacterium]|nr:ABC transporter ATP-binding protein [Alphaproteobacteria bacterium]
MQNITHRYGPLRAVDALSLRVRPGEVVCLLGPSGCGKSTVLRLAAGLERLQAGAVAIAGSVVADARAGTDMPPEDRGVGMVFQDYALFPHLNVIDNVAFGLQGAIAERRARATAVLAQVGVEEYAAAYPHVLSGGQQQRVALARALAPKPGVMLLDEPFSGLDARLRDPVRDATLHALKNSGAACLLVTHDPDEAMFMADRIAVMREGRIVQLGPPVELYCRPADAFVARFFGEINALSATVARGAAATPFGAVPSTLPEGSAVDVLIRPEALKLTAANGAGQPAARVVAARMLGRSSLIHLAVGEGDGAGVGQRPLHLHARVPGRFLPAENSLVAVALDLDQTFVFAASS